MVCRTDIQSNWRDMANQTVVGRVGTPELNETVLVWWPGGTWVEATVTAVHPSPWTWNLRNPRPGRGGEAGQPPLLEYRCSDGWVGITSRFLRKPQS